MDGQKSIETGPDIFGNLMYDKIGILVQWEKEALFSKRASVTHSQSRKSKTRSWAVTYKTFKSIKSAKDKI